MVVGISSGYENLDYHGGFGGAREEMAGELRESAGGEPSSPCLYVQLFDGITCVKY